MKTKRRKIKEEKARYLYEILQRFGIKVDAIYSHLEERPCFFNIMQFSTREENFLAVLAEEDIATHNSLYYFKNVISVNFRPVIANDPILSKSTLLWNEKKQQKYLNSLSKKNENPSN